MPECKGNPNRYPSLIWLGDLADQALAELECKRNAVNSNRLAALVDVDQRSAIEQLDLLQSTSASSPSQPADERPLWYGDLTAFQHRSCQRIKAKTA